MKAGLHRLPRSLTLVFLMGAAPAQVRNERPPLKEMDSVRTLYLAPFSTEDAQNAPLRIALKSELVHAGFAVLDKEQGSDATLSIEVSSGQEGKQARLEFHSALGGGPDSNVAWHLSAAKTGPDMARLVDNAARQIAGSLKSYRLDVVTKKSDQKEKERKR